MARRGALGLRGLGRRGFRTFRAFGGFCRCRILLRATGALPGLARGGGLLASALRLALGFFQALARALQLVFGDAYPLLRDLGL
jgi:hypothetical protein